MKNIKITVMRLTRYEDLMAQYENCQRPEGLCESAWETMLPFIRSLAEGKGNFFDGWMKNPLSAMLSCNDGFRPVSFYLEVIED